MLSSFWILRNNSCMQVPAGHVITDGKIIPENWRAITNGPIVGVRWPHMQLGGFPHHGQEGHRHRCLAPAARPASAGGAPDAALEFGAVYVAGSIAGAVRSPGGPPAKCWSRSRPMGKRNLFALEVPRLGTSSLREIGLGARPTSMPSRRGIVRRSSFRSSRFALADALASERGAPRENWSDHHAIWRQRTRTTKC
jgi:hypothetical protein